MARKTAKDYRKEYNELNKQLNALEARIKERALKLCAKYPDVMVGKITDAKYFAEYHNEQPASLRIENYLHAIEAIEAELAKRDVYVQTKMF